MPPCASTAAASESGSKGNKRRKREGGSREEEERDTADERTLTFKKIIALRSEAAQRLLKFLLESSQVLQFPCARVCVRIGAPRQLSSSYIWGREKMFCTLFFCFGDTTTYALICRGVLTCSLLLHLTRTRECRHAHVQAHAAALFPVSARIPVWGKGGRRARAGSLAGSGWESIGCQNSATNRMSSCNLT